MHSKQYQLSSIRMNTDSLWNTFVLFKHLGKLFEIPNAIYYIINKYFKPIKLKHNYMQDTKLLLPLFQQHFIFLSQLHFLVQSHMTNNHGNISSFVTHD